MPVFVTGGSRQSVIQKTSLHEDSSGHHNTARFRVTSNSRLHRRCFFLDEFDPSSSDSHAVQRIETEKNLRALFGPAAVEAPTWDQTLAEHLEWSHDQSTTQDMASKTLAAVRWALPNLPQPMSRSFSSAITCLLQRQGYWYCWWLDGWRNTTKHFWVSTFACSSKRACASRKDWRCEASSDFRRAEEFLEPRESGDHSSEQASCGSLAKQASTTPACRWTWLSIIFCFPQCSCSEQPTSPKDGRSARATPL